MIYIKVIARQAIVDQGEDPRNIMGIEIDKFEPVSSTCSIAYTRVILRSGAAYHVPVRVGVTYHDPVAME